MKGKVVVASFNEVSDAEAARQKLQDVGIEADVYDESKLQKYWFLSKPIAGEKVRVEEEDFERAKAALGAANETDHVLENALTCPQCGSSRIQYPQFTRKFFTTTLVEVFCFLGVIPKEFYCLDCHYTWPPLEKLDPQRDVLNWPTSKKWL